MQIFTAFLTMDWNSLVMVCTDSETVKSEGRRMNLLEEKDVK